MSTDEQLAQVAWAALKVFFALLLVPVSLVWEAFVILTLWGWFVVPTFGAPALTLASAVGICMLVGLLTIRYRKEDVEKAGEKLLRLWLQTTICPAIALLVGWTAKQWM